MLKQNCEQLKSVFCWQSFIVWKSFTQNTRQILFVFMQPHFAAGCTKHNMLSQSYFHWTFLMQVSLKVGQVISVFLFNQMEHHGRIYNLAGAYSFFSLCFTCCLQSNCLHPPVYSSISIRWLGSCESVLYLKYNKCHKPRESKELFYLPLFDSWQCGGERGACHETEVPGWNQNCRCCMVFTLTTIRSPVQNIKCVCICTDTQTYSR